ncbi:microtubule-associated tumor suppressor 1 homolog A isoform X1 [Melanotaenia boesemani]|uniref:microtubule-associated tumor suppressor 1 homolog A isoform X1 n=1 Tax=Melanotaenia boesemani TaxID=1250792 RepID=UPI001C051A9B|nr:microtubule-associated tumor suppressor 1 homolog A isoform X1 [Melanotaenia boesemani]XP_041846979.1 microtubule-associated tumor suppressor 1 homolog A isoform X1 [Melanotaenia boesemani]XP_041846980.1 microtubule-associated tumor suppressor 1 homolog A isoform X1 [Melanotaenia boesemani]XP_041846981.1 microtubule-associated tumor suppressor 1 homolog A isoform X1 [Melanotaenia boesemani]XP_041846982.1 microtubule-associated tumor suppressor 1 homolog A isoform X1 [Melanotaenia boesemani]
MSETFSMPTDQFVLCPSNVYVSPDSNSNLSNLNEQEAINIVACSPVGNVHNGSCSQEDLLCVVTSTMDQTFIATPVSSSSNFWNEGMSHASNEQTEPALFLHFNKSTEDEGNDEGMSPDSDWRENQLSSRETSCRGSSENDCCSLSSGEMVIRSNSFCLEEESLIAISSLDESSISPAASRLLFPFESNFLSTTLPDVCQKSTGMTEENTGHPCLGVTFTQADSLEILTEEKYITTPSSVVALPNENEGGLLTTFICESSADPINEATSASTEAESLPHLSSTFTPEQGITFVSPMQRNDFHTSTPVQNIENNILGLSPFSPCAENSGSPGHQLAKRQQVSLSHKRHPVAGLPKSLSKLKKMEIHKFSKPGLSGAKFNTLTRAQHQVVVPGSASQQKPLQANGLNKQSETNRGTAVRVPLAKTATCTTVVSTSNMLYDAHRQSNRKAANLGVTVRQSYGRTVDGQSKARASPADHNPAANNHVFPVHCTNTSSEMMQGPSSQVSDISALHAGSQTCASSLEKSPTTSGQMDPKATPKKDVSHKIEVRSGLARGQDKLPLHKTRPSSSSESSSASRPPKKRTSFRFATSVTIPKADTDQGLNKPASQKCSSQNNQVEETKRPADNSPREVKKISLVAEPGKSTASGESCDESKRRSHGLPSPKQRRTLPQPPPASPRPPPLSTRQRQGALGRDEYRISRGAGTAPFQQNSAGSQRTEGSSLGSKPQLTGSWPPQTPRPSLMGPPPSTPYRQPRKTLGPSRGFTDCNVHSELGQGNRSSSVSGGVPHKPTPLKPVVLRSRLISTPGKTSGPTLTTTCKEAASTSKGASSSAAALLKRTTNSRSVQPTSRGPVDKSKSKASSRQQTSQPNQSTGSQNVVQTSVPQVEKEVQNIHQLQQLLTASNCRFQAVAIVLQQTLAERDEATRQCRELSQELVSLRGELVCSIHSSERLGKEKEELRAALEDALQKMQEQHQKDQTELEQRLQAFYQAEWDRARLGHQEEADKCQTLMQQQMEELKANQEAMKLELENNHTEQLQCVKHQYETKLDELREVHKQDLKSLDKTLKDAEANLSGQLQTLTVENNALIERLAAEENRRKELAQNSQKDTHTLYLEQELESLKVVLEMKNKQLHQQEKKLMEVDKLTEKNVKLDESLKKVQQENEDLKARMERHAALSRQLSTEQVMLQESLQKESKVNKRLSMENEELLWKLHNGDLSSPRKTSPISASPSHSFSLHSPRSSGLFSSPPLSPR